MPQALFPLGNMFITPGALAACHACAVTPAIILGRHVAGDWQDISCEDQAANRRAIDEGERVFSAYQIGAQRLFVVTEADRSLTTLLLADEY